MYFNSLPNAKVYKKDHFVIENGRVKWVQSENKDELVRLFGYDNVFDTKADANTALEERKRPPKHHLDDDERKKLEEEQLAYGRSMMSEEELAEVEYAKKTLDQIQLEWGLLMYARELACCN